MKRQDYLQDLDATIVAERVWSFTDHATEIEAITTGVAVFDLHHRDQLFVQGSDSAAYLNRLLTFDIKSMQPGDGARPFLLDARGRIILTFNLYCLEPDRFHIDASPGHGEEISTRLEMFHFGEDISWGPMNGLMISSLQGEAVAPLLQKLGFEVPNAAMAHHEGQLADSTVRVVRHDRIGSVGYDLLHEEHDFCRLWSAIRAAGATAAGARSLETMRIGGGIPQHPNEFGAHSVPLEAGGMDGISEGKGCYPGQEVIERTLALGRPARNLVAVESGETIEVGPLSNEEGRSVGELTSVAQLPDGRHIGLALIKHAARNLTAMERDGSVVEVRNLGER